MENEIKVSKRIFFEAILIALIPTLTVFLNRFLSFQTNLPYLGSTITILGQYILSSIVLTFILLIEGMKISQLFLVTLLFNSILFLLRLLSFALPSKVSSIFAMILPFTYIGVESVFLASIPLVENFESIDAFYGVLFIVVLKFVINYFVMLPILNTVTNIHVVILLIFISQLIPMVLFARFPFNLVKLSFKEAFSKSLKEFREHLRASLTIGSIYSIIIAVVSVWQAIETSQFLLPFLLNYISLIIFVYFFVWISEYEKAEYER